MQSSTLYRAESTPHTGTTWSIDPIHSAIGFAVKHMMFATVHGRFGNFQGAIRFDGGRPAAVEAQIDAATIDTGIKKRDDHLRSADFLDALVYPTISFHSTRIEPVSALDRYHWTVVGDLTLSGVSRSVELAVEQAGGRDRPDADVLEFRAATKINRKDFGMEFNLPIEGGGLVVGDEVKVTIRVQAHRLPSIPA